MFKKPKRVCVIGDGNWATLVAKIVANNVIKLKNFDKCVTMYVYEENWEGKPLSDVINDIHENIKYLPGQKLPPNVVAVPDVVEAAKLANYIIFVIPHRYIRILCSTLLEKIKPNAVALSFVKGFNETSRGGIKLISQVIPRYLGIPCSVLMGTNLAGDVGDEKFCDAVLGCTNSKVAPVLRNLIETDYLRIVVTDDEYTVGLCGTLNNIVACAAAVIDGLGLGNSTKAAVIRMGLMEVIKFADIFYPEGKFKTFLESCGIADLITTCYSGRNRRIIEAFVRTGKSIPQLEGEMLNGQKIQGPRIAKEVNYLLRNKHMEDDFPLFTAVHKLCITEILPYDFIAYIRDPGHIYIPKHITFTD